MTVHTVHIWPFVPLEKQFYIALLYIMYNMQKYVINIHSIPLFAVS